MVQIYQNKHQFSKIGRYGFVRKSYQNVAQSRKSCVLTLPRLLYPIRQWSTSVQQPSTSCPKPPRRAQGGIITPFIVLMTLKDPQIYDEMTPDRCWWGFYSLSAGYCGLPFRNSPPSGSKARSSSALRATSLGRQRSPRPSMALASIQTPKTHKKALSHSHSTSPPRDEAERARVQAVFLPVMPRCAVSQATGRQINITYTHWARPGRGIKRQVRREASRFSDLGGYII